MDRRVIRKLSKSLRDYRKVHRYIGLGIAILVLFSALTGLLLAWKKDIAVLQPPTKKGEAVEMGQWAPVEKLAIAAVDAVDSLALSRENIERIEYRPSKGIAKVIFDTGNWEVQIDASSLEVLSIARRHSDWIESIHDGTIISDFFKLVSMNVLGLGLLILVASGLWLWFGPKKIRKLKR